MHISATSIGEDEMSSRDERDEARLAIEIEPGLRKRVEAAASARGMSVRDYVAAALHEILDSEGSARPANLSGE
jgi:hypothetical protein